jgi:hypothetical protein
MSKNEELQSVGVMSWGGLVEEYERRSGTKYGARDWGQLEKRSQLEASVTRLRRRDELDANRSPRLTLEQARESDALMSSARRERTRGLVGTASHRVAERAKEERAQDHRLCSPGCAYCLELAQSADAHEEAELQLCAHVLGLMWQANYDDGRQQALADAVAITGRP